LSSIELAILDKFMNTLPHSLFILNTLQIKPKSNLIVFFFFFFCFLSTPSYDSSNGSPCNNICTLSSFSPDSHHTFHAHPNNTKIAQVRGKQSKTTTHTSTIYSNLQSPPPFFTFNIIQIDSYLNSTNGPPSTATTTTTA
jgi:hypothetical protein